jgi:alkanesulfonate monooxygenase SsuD/methylene tetrahydromethanopterin reductase-like flavin-dependent oxidoreductase (luciferase family)
MVTIGMRFDLRCPSFASPSHADLYEACLDQCAWADGVGADVVVLSEHHGVDDGFLPAPLTLAAAIVARTKRIRVNVAAALLPLHDPIRFAEQLVVLDLISRGRVSVVAGLGYRPEEFDMAGVRREDRAKLLEESVEVMRRAWTGEPFEWRGRTIRVTPKPQSPPAVFVGGSTPEADRSLRSRMRPPRLPRRFRPTADEPRLRPRQREPGTGLAPHRAVRTVRRAILCLLADTRSAIRRSRLRRYGGGRAQERRLSGGHAG